MVKRDSCKLSLNLFWKQLLKNVPSSFKYVSDFYVNKGSDEWCKVIALRKEDRTFRLALEVAFPSFPFYYKTCVAIKVYEDNPFTGVTKQSKVEYVKLYDLTNDFHRTIYSKGDTTYEVDETNAKYIYESCSKVAFALLNSVFSNGGKKN